MELLRKLLVGARTLEGIPCWSFCHYFFLLPGTGLITGAPAAILYHEVTLRMRVRIQILEQKSRGLLGYISTELSTLDLREIDLMIIGSVILGFLKKSR